MTEWAIDRLRPDPKNREVFDPLGSEDLMALVESIHEHGLINPIAIRPDGLIIAGEQRWQAAKLARLAGVPVTVRDADDREVELLRIEENLRRRILKPSETVRAIQRLDELHGMGRDKPKASDQTPAPSAAVAEQVGMSERQTRAYRSLSNLIPSLMALLDAEAITQKVALQFAQIEPEDQELIAAAFAPEDLADKTPDELRQVKLQVRELNAQLKRAEEALAKADAEHQVELEAEVAAMREKKDREIRALRDERDRARQWARSDAVHTALAKLGAVTGMSVEQYAEYVGRFGSLEVYIQADIELAEQAVPWLNDLARHLRARLNQSEKGIRAIR